MVEVNSKHGLLTVISYKGIERGSCNKTNKIWICKCECGNIVERSTNQLRFHPRSCGCLRRQRGANNPRFTGYEEISGAFWYGTTKNAERRNLKVNIGLKDVWNKYLKQDRRCILSGVEISFKNKTASLDRINSKIGYTRNNIQLVHKVVNIMKNKLSDEDFIHWCKLIANYREQ